jgi:hypothetical protein
LLRRVKTIYAICGGEVPAVGGGKKDDFHAKKSVLIAQLHNFDQLVQARDTCGLPHDSRDFIRLKATVTTELKKLEEMVTDLAAQHRKEVAKAGSKMDGNELTARKEVMESIMGEFRDAFKHAKGFAHADSDEMNQAGTGINVMTRDQLEKGQFAGAGIRTKRQELSGEQLQKMEEINAQTREQDSMLDEISKGLDELQNLAEKMSDVRVPAGATGSAVTRVAACARRPPPVASLLLTMLAASVLSRCCCVHCLCGLQELQLQDKMLSDLESKTDKTQSKMDQTNDRMKVRRWMHRLRTVLHVEACGGGCAGREQGPSRLVARRFAPYRAPALPLAAQEAMKKLNDKSSNVCVYLICLMILLGLVAVVSGFPAVLVIGCERPDQLWSCTTSPPSLLTPYALPAHFRPSAT